MSSRGAGDGLWRSQNAQATEVLRGADGALLEPPAVSANGRRVAVVLRRNGKLHLNVATADGSELRAVAESIDVGGVASWSPDDKWIVTGGTDAKGPALFKIPVEGGGAPIRLVAGAAKDPVWSPDGTLIVYAGVNVGGQSPLVAVRPDGAAVELPPIRFLATGGERYRFLPTGKSLIYMQGTRPSQDFWLLDLVTKKSRPLTHLTGSAAMRTFDLSPDGKQIVFDRLRENSDVVLIDRPRNSQKP